MAGATAAAVLGAHAAEVFAYFDRNHDGKLSLQELSEAMQAVGQYPTSKELAALVQRHASGKSAVDAAAYLAMAKDHAAANAQFEKDLKQAFMAFDPEGSGSIDQQEFTRAMTTVGDKLSVAEVRNLFATADFAANDQLDYIELIRMLSSTT